MAANPYDPDSFFPFSHPLYMRYQAAVAHESDLRVRRVSALLILTCPLAMLNDPQACATHLQGPAAAGPLEKLMDDAKQAVDPHLQTAEMAAVQVAADNDRLDEIRRRRRDLPNEIIEGPSGHTTRQQNREELAQNQQVAAQRELVGDIEHKRIPGAGWKGIVTAILIAIIETALTLRVFNIAFTHLDPLAFLQWLGITVALAIFNAYVAAHLGRRCRDAREIEDAAHRLNQMAASQLHYPNEGPS